MLFRLPKAAAAMAAMSRNRKLASLTWEKRGASRTPAKPAKRLDRIQAMELTWSALMPASSVMRGLSTVARMRSPICDHRKSAVRPSTATTVTRTVATWFPSMA